MSPTRRALLDSAALGAVGALAGCFGDDPADGSGPVARSSAVSGTDTDPTVVKPRNPDGDRVLVDGSEATDDGEPVSVGRELVTTADRAAELLPAEGVAEEDRRRVREFFDETDYDAETVYVSPAGILSCQRLEIDSVSWRPGRVEYEYCRELRPPDAACEADTRVAMALLFRLPVALDERIGGSGSSGRSPCRTTNTEYSVIDGNATVPGNATATNEWGDF
ncbi:hypothetical protein [Halorubrum sp. Atlit-28R]|uniref:hypothetical protein n=1 Tax=Halorubrum sp. Atlit-28R TaxID=2282129 RepID=UPI000EF1AE4C|nr:hypothetical protein [Halorubrum sp. Atlit-28R]RLM51763.1 hypothetical protein DVK06_05020 [Halorubrum sp. Atlit-28R]